MRLMKSVRVLALMLLLTVLVSGFGTSAQGNTTSGADLMPDDVFVYASIRTDQGYIETLDGLLMNLYSQAAAALPPELTGGMLPPLQNPVTMALNDAFDGDFDTEIRPWLGDEVSIGIGGDLTGETTPDVIVVADITDRSVALSYLESELEFGRPEATELDDFDVIVDRNPDFGFDGVLAVNDNVAIVATNEDLLPPNLNDTLSSNSTFTKAVDSLPEESYNILVYLDGTQFLPLIQASAQMTGTVDPATLDFLNDAFAPLGGAAFGATILDGATLTIDGSVVTSDNALADVLTPVDPAFMDVLPAGSDFVIHGSNLAGSVNASLQNAQDLADVGDPNAPQISDILAQLDGAMLVGAGIDFTDDVLGWMTSDYAIYMDYQPLPIDALSLVNAATYPDGPPSDVPINIEIGFAVRTTDLTAATTVVDGLARLLGELALPAQLSRETIAGANALVISIPAPGIDMPDIVIAANEAVFVIGTRDSATAILNGEGGLLSDPMIVDSANYYLPQANQVWYVNGPEFIILTGDFVAGGLVALGPAIDNIFNEIIAGLGGDEPPPPTEPDYDQLRASIAQTQEAMRSLTGLIDHATISSAYVDGVSRVRMTITVGN